MIWNIVLIGLNVTLHRRPHLYILSRSLFILREEVKGLVKMSRREVSSVLKKCIECGNQHSILHLLYECPNSSILWRLVEECFGYSVSPYKIIFGDSEETYINFIISLICYLLYKYWLLRKNEHITLSLKYFIVNELEYRNQVYRILNWAEIQVNINKLKHYIMLFIFI